jgi:integrase
MRVLTPDAEQRLLAQCGPPLTPLVVTAVHTGFRKSALLSLSWEDVDCHQRLLTVQAAYAKNGDSRSVPMNEELLATLKMCKMTIPSHGPVFRTHHGTPYRSFWAAFEHAVHTAGIADLTFMTCGIRLLAGWL